ncbi:Toxin-antitoxin system, toxin component, GNAT family [uncultured Eubacteriales bacterium]|uniref:Toxin-antitoxin system, toxin component, GNAT family n=1 Tax=uncultured Eubacteriales bacterium TaxID=172733 RepID=A0A212JWY7_9FIRM|nr:Toxin-antitoxin system, toxin component, GNAT family [uncultured Eubacteriales bacterium]
MEFTIRPPRPEDAEELWELRRMPGVFENTMGLPSNRVTQTQEFIAGLDVDDHQFVAVTEDGHVVGLAGLMLFSNPRKRHMASLGIYVHTDYQNQGAGTALVKALLELADNWLMLVRVELDVYTDNAKAIHLYEKLGFEREGVLRKAAIRNGRYADLLMMSRLRHTGE